MNKSIVKIFLFIIFVSQCSFAADSKYYNEKYNTTKKLYLGAIMSNDKKQEIAYLKKLILYGDKLNANTLKYKRELNRLDNTPILRSSVQSVRSVLPQPKVITSVIQSKNSIIINFNHTINKSFIDFKERKSGRTYYDEFYIKGNFKDAQPLKLKINGVDKITILQKKKNLLSLVFRDKTNLKTIYIINKKQIIIKVLDLKSTKSKQQKSGVNKTTKNSATVLDRNILYPSKKIIVLDPGHGGRDPGATSKKKYEKDVTLNITKYLKADLERKGFKVYMTRTKDVYVKLSTRTKYANKKHADIFVSVHANAAPKKSARKAQGVESYFLSPARSARAKRVAALENKGEMTGMGWSSKDSLLTILNQAKITAANKMAIDIQKHMLYSLRKTYGKSAIRDGGVREGPFWVLVGAQMPSVLLEVGYITHPKEGYRITTKKYQKLIAQGIADGIESYFIKN